VENISTASIKEIKIARDIVQEIRNYGVNDNIICMIVSQLALDITDLQLMKDMREVANRGSIMSDLKEIGLKELDNVQQELTTQTNGGENE
jgi:hypothetical protein